MDIKWDLYVILICFSLISIEIGNLFLWLLATHFLFCSIFYCGVFISVFLCSG